MDLECSHLEECNLLCSTEVINECLRCYLDSSMSPRLFSFSWLKTWWTRDGWCTRVSNFVWRIFFCWRAGKLCYSFLVERHEGMKLETFQVLKSFSEKGFRQVLKYQATQHFGEHARVRINESYATSITQCFNFINSVNVFQKFLPKFRECTWVQAIIRQETMWKLGGDSTAKTWCSLNEALEMKNKFIVIHFFCRFSYLSLSHCVSYRFPSYTPDKMQTKILRKQFLCNHKKSLVSCRKMPLKRKPPFSNVTEKSDRKNKWLHSNLYSATCLWTVNNK